MKLITPLLVLLFIEYDILSQPVFKNPGIPDSETYEINEHFDMKVGNIITKINIELKERDHSKYYAIHVNEGNLYTNEIEVNYSDLTTISEKRTSLETNTLVQYFIKNGDKVQFGNLEKGVKKNFQTSETNIYSPLAYLISFRGFPFEIGKTVSIRSYMYEYGDVLTMKVTNTAMEKVKVTAGVYDCYVLELSVGGWQSFFAPEKYYLYFTVASPHIFVQYREPVDGAWYADELINYIAGGQK
jgi:hypothetical protein